jgi:3-hydroxyacyl-CoA dehydrogenase
MWYADSVGLAKVVERLQALAPVLSSDFSLSPLLLRLAAEGGRFTA